MADPVDQDIAQRVRAEFARQNRDGADRATMACLSGLTLRQFKRRFYGEVPFTAGQLVVVATVLGKPADHFLNPDPDQVAAVA